MSQVSYKVQPIGVHGNTVLHHMAIEEDGWKIVASWYSHYGYMGNSLYFAVIVDPTGKKYLVNDPERERITEDDVFSDLAKARS